MKHDQADTIELRVLYGPQAGSRLALMNGQEYLLGTSDECTVMLSGPRVAKQHAQIYFDNKQPCLVPLEGAVCDAHGNTQTDRFPLTFGIPIELGGIWIAVDYVDSPWPDTEEILPSADKAAAAPQEPLDAMEVRSPALAEISVDSGNPKPAVAQQRFPLGKVVITLGLLAISGSVLAMWLGNALGADANTKDTAVKVVRPVVHTLPAAIRHAIHGQDSGNTLKADWGEKGGWVISGYVSTAVQKQSLEAELEFVIPRPTAHIFVEEEIVAAANALLHDQEISSEKMIHAENAGGGKLRLTGAVLNATMVRDASKEIKDKVPGVQDIESAVLLPEKLRSLFKEKIEAAGLADRLKFVKETPEIVLKGNLTNSEVARWEKMFFDFSHDYGSIVPIRADVGGETHTVALDVQTIVGGPIPYIVMASGERVNTGGTISGRTIVSIKDGTVVFDGNETLRDTK